MIRLANEQDFSRTISSENELRICALKQAYGLGAPFIRFFADDEGSLASVMDGFCTFHCVAVPNDEWCAFLQMYPDIRTIHSHEPAIAYLAEKYGLSYEKGPIWQLDELSSENALQAFEDAEVSLREVYALLFSVFDDLPPFEGWYVDASHRVRHGCSHIAAVKAGEQLISTAMTLAETDSVALIGGVATLPDHRGQGAASQCIRRLIDSLTQKTILIAPSDENAEKLYSKLGFVPSETWAELVLP